ncbi:carboxylesterase [Poronia punctata]|nr:carboxylesterase [Poronia punctata]
MYRLILSSLLLLSTIQVFAQVPEPGPEPEPLDPRFIKTASVELSLGTVVGNVMNKVESFGGIPYADAPVGKLRLRPPQRRTEPWGKFDATGPAAACPQVFANPEDENLLFSLVGGLTNHPFVQKVTGQTEDCLTITVARPEGVKAGDKLPVLYWIYGGGYQFGWSSMYDGTGLVNHGVRMGEPFIFVAVNYRVAGFGFMPGKEVLEDGATNLGLRDQRMGLEWVADNIAAFGGDPDKVTIWGESAGAFSVFNQLVLYGGNHTYKGNPLFRGGIMSSGSIIPSLPIDGEKAQAVYDAVVVSAGCGAEWDSLTCLREKDYDTFLNAVSAAPSFLSYRALAFSYFPQVDGDVLPDSPEALLSSGQFAKVPFLIGDMEDEGTLVAILQPNLTTTDSLVDYFHKLYYPDAPIDKITELVNLYPDGVKGVVAGAPYRTGLLNDIYPGFKRRASIFGDLVFTHPRRFLLEYMAENYPETPTWSYIGSWNHGTPVLGTFHASDLLQTFYGTWNNYAARSTRTYYVNFVRNLDPNVGAEGYPNWPRWSQGKRLIQFFANRVGFKKDDYRQEISDFFGNNIASFRF